MWEEGAAVRAVFIHLCFNSESSGFFPFSNLLFLCLVGVDLDKMLFVFLVDSVRLSHWPSVIFPWSTLIDLQQGCKVYPEPVF